MRQRDLVRQRDGGDRDDRRREHHPAGEPGDVRRAEPLGPVVDRARDRIARGELAEAERDHQLAGEHHRPRPPVGRAAEREAEVEELERAGEDRDVADPRREGGEAPERAVELLLVAELVELGIVGRARVNRRRHASSPFLVNRSDRPPKEPDPIAREYLRATGQCQETDISRPVAGRRRLPRAPPAVRLAGARRRRAGGRGGRGRVPPRGHGDLPAGRRAGRARLGGAHRRGRDRPRRPRARPARAGRAVRARLDALGPADRLRGGRGRGLALLPHPRGGGAAAAGAAGGPALRDALAARGARRRRPRGAGGQPRAAAGRRADPPAARALHARTPRSARPHA